MDDSSGYGEQINPYNPSLSRGLSAFDTPTISSSATAMFAFRQIGRTETADQRMAISGITRFSTGLPVTLVEHDDHSLLGTSFGGPIILPGRHSGLRWSARKDRSAKNDGQYFNPAAFTPRRSAWKATPSGDFSTGRGSTIGNLPSAKTRVHRAGKLAFPCRVFQCLQPRAVLHAQRMLTGQTWRTVRAIGLSGRYARRRRASASCR